MFPDKHHRLFSIRDKPKEEWNRYQHIYSLHMSSTFSCSLKIMYSTLLNQQSIKRHVKSMPQGMSTFSYLPTIFIFQCKFCFRIKIKA